MTARTTVAEATVAGVGLVVPPAGLARGAAWFDYRTRLGPRGYKYLPDACQYLLAAAREAMGSPGGEVMTQLLAEERRAAVVGTNSAVAPLHAEIEETVRQDGIRLLSPMTTPFFSVNLVAAKLSTEHGIKGSNLTLTSERVAGVQALHVAAQQLAEGRCDVVLAGATEAADPLCGTATPEEGAALFMLRPREAGTTADSASLRTALCFLPPAALDRAAGRERARHAVCAALDALHAPSLPASGLASVRLVTDASPVAAAVETSVRAWCGTRASVTTKLSGPRAGALAPVELLARALRADGPGAHLVVVAGRSGNAALALIRTPDTADSTAPRP
ncbi:beta-ketoacyl synthase N-terminal-like domain-containing protein [Streptomyces seoulensis]|uniref:beta-ketoacyl synthase N-terminal-like domain-containing protein n=1 Tax=Streptomyces seoulensis TaxID=73044 RepID=UPI00068DB590|nr:beta-ketoacyl synthase N-terminal-like domain-containing protein [Streptomyces seoulensis]